jgi:hypothetical protein
MNTNRKTAIIVGVLFIIGTVAGILSVIFTGSILGDPDYLIKVSANENQIIIGALFVLMMGLALALVPVMMFPIFKKQNEALALGYVVFRGALETVTCIATVISWLLLIRVSQEYLKAGASVASYFQTLGTLLHEVTDQINPIGGIVFSLGALMFYFLFYQSKLIPRWLSGWGTGLAGMFALTSSLSTIDVWALPIFLQEMVMAVWLIVKGFNPPAIASGSVKTDVN